MASLTNLPAESSHSNAASVMATKVAVLTTPQQWFVPYAEQLARELQCHLFATRGYSTHD